MLIHKSKNLFLIKNKSAVCPWHKKKHNWGIPTKNARKCKKKISKHSSPNPVLSIICRINAAISRKMPNQKCIKYRVLMASQFCWFPLSHFGFEREMCARTFFEYCWVLWGSLTIDRYLLPFPFAAVGNLFKFYYKLRWKCPRIIHC